MDDEEVWKPIEDHTDYEVSTWGNVASTRFGKIRILQLHSDERGRQSVDIGSHHRVFVHNLVGCSFLSKPGDCIEIDHIDRNPSNNNVSNLRWVSKSHNQANRVLSNSCGMKGIRFKKSRKSKPYEAQITHDGKYYYLGTFTTPEEAHEAYKAKAKELFGEFACTESK